MKARAKDCMAKISPGDDAMQKENNAHGVAMIPTGESWIRYFAGGKEMEQRQMGSLVIPMGTS